MRARLSAAAALAAIAFVCGSTAHAAHAVSACGSGYYRNVSGRCVHSPVRAASPPAGASAKCRDDTYSFSQHHSGTCSGHGGVAIFYR